MIRRLSFAALLLIAVGTASARLAAQTSAPRPLTLDAALTQALAGNKTLAAARLRPAVDAAGAQVALERPNPEFTYEFEKEAPHHAFSAAFPIEIGGKRARRNDLATATAGASTATLAQLTLDVQTNVRRAYFTLAAALRRADIATEIRALAQRARDAADGRVTAGDAPRLERLQAELELADTDNDVAAARADITSARAVLNALLGQPAATPIVTADALTAVGPSLPTNEAVLAQALATNVDLAVLDREIDAQVARRNLAQSLTKPDVTAGGTLVYDAPDEFRFGWRGMVSVTIPVFTRHQAAVALEDAALAQMRAERDALASDIAARITEAAARATAAREQLDRFTADILPRSLEVEQMAQESYRAGQTGLSALLQTVQSARALRLRSVQAGLDAQLALADLERALGASRK